MYDDLNHPDDRTPPEPGYQPPQRPAAEKGPTAPLPDREVPLPSSATNLLLHQWLDGDVDVAVMRASSGGNETVDLWTKIHDEAETLRGRTTPLYVHKRIMDSLPADSYRLHQPWYRRPVTMNPVMIAAAAAAMLGLGIAIAHAAFR